MVDTLDRGSGTPIGDGGDDWPAAIEFSPEQNVRFGVQWQHHRDIWIQWVRLLVGGTIIAAGWLVWHTLILLSPPNGLDEQANHRLQQSLVHIEAPSALAILAVIATLVVAVSVAVRGLADPQANNSQGIDEARRTFLTATVGVLGAIGVAIAVLAVVWNVNTDGWGLPGECALLLIAGATSAIAADSMTVLGRARSANPAFANWVREQHVERIQRGARRARQNLEKVCRRDRLIVLAKSTIVLIGAGFLLGVGLLWTFPDELVHSFWSIPDRLWRSMLASLIAGGISLLIGHRLVLAWLLRDWWYLIYWTLMAFFVATALTIAALAAIVESPARAQQVGLPMLLGTPAMVGLLVLALNFGPAHQLARNRRLSRLVPDLRRLRGGELWRRIDNRRRANAKVVAESTPTD